MRKLSTLDLAFILTETVASPKHVAGLMLCRKPESAPANFARQLIAELKTHNQPTEPFNLVIKMLGLKGPHWEADRQFDIDQHVFYHKPKKTISWNEVQEFIARLHEPLLDRSRPLWEYHLVDGIEGGRFAVYTKVHHAYADGVTMARWVSDSLSTSADDMELKPAWAIRRRRKKKMAVKEKSSVIGTVGGLSKQAWSQVLTTGGMAKLAAQQTLERAGVTRSAVAVAFSADNETPLTGSGSPGRSIATTWVTMDDMKQVCKDARATINHVALSCIDGGLHRYLEASGHAVDHPLTIQMPINLRSDKNDKQGNQVGVMLVELAEPGHDSLKRFQEVGYKLRTVKNQIDSVPGDSIEQYSILMAVTGELIEKLKLTDRLPTHGHTLVSNLPGPAEPLYLKGAKVEQMFPISVLLPGLHMNITLFSVSGVLNFGIVATRDLPELQSLADYIEEEFRVLEAHFSG